MDVSASAHGPKQALVPAMALVALLFTSSYSFLLTPNPTLNCPILEMSPLSTKSHQESSGTSVGDRAKVVHDNVLRTYLVDDLHLRDLDHPESSHVHLVDAHLVKEDLEQHANPER